MLKSGNVFCLYLSMKKLMGTTYGLEINIDKFYKFRNDKRKKSSSIEKLQ